MHRVLAMCLDAAIAAVILVPLFYILNRKYFRNTVRTLLYAIFAVYLCGMFAVVGLPDIRYIRFDPNFNFVPFAYMFSDFTNSFLNILLFLPFGFSLPVFWTHFHKVSRTVLFGFSISVLIEILQIFTFRATDVNDLMTNTLGTFVGWCFAKILLTFIPGLQPGQNHKELYVISLSAFFVMFFIQPFFANWIFLCF